MKKIMLLMFVFLVCSSFVIAQTIVSGNNDGWMMIYTPQLEEKEQSQDDIFNCQFNNNEDIIECIKRSYALSFNQNQWVGINIENLPQNRFDGNDPRDEEIKHYFITWIYNKADSTDTREISFRKFNEHLQIIRIYEGNCNENRECSLLNLTTQKHQIINSLLTTKKDLLQITT